ncbi:hypothetical protein MCUN1_003306 [Malassezia cuniculi]|uniref:Protein CASP n=1 Tax=Malassezia cuniculi TaxID=948313 RepID=A0AAF0F163_9BASI|nr:hypothetical protein MCUN1_003306 [Malassezia cuniculi]
MATELESAVASWRSANLADLQTRLAQQVPRTQQAQHDALASRKALAERTKEFKRRPPEEQLGEVRTLLRAYQTEIDQLTARCRIAEQFVTDTNTSLSGVSDPAPIIEELLHDHSKAEAAARESATEAADCRTAAIDARRAADEAQRSVEQRITDAVAAAESRWAEREAQLQRTITASQNQIRQLHASHEHAARTLTRDDTQLESLVGDLQRANERAAQAERRAQHQQAAHERTVQENAAHHAHEIQLLHERLAAAESAAKAHHDTRWDEEKERFLSQEKALQSQIHEATQTIEALRATLSEQSDYAQLKNELGRQSGSGKSAADTSQLKRLEDELVSLRLALADEKNASTTATSALSAAQAEVSRLSALSAKLESDVSRLGQTDAQTDAPADSGLLSIVTGQRDRFRSRNAELEEELRRQVEALAELRSETQRLQADNLSMYEKVRYLERTGPKYPPGATTITVDEPYRKHYEQSLNPFEAFRGREQTRAVAALSPVDRLLHTFTRAIVGSAYVRLAIVCYAAILHLLVFFIIYDASHDAAAAAIGN